jgi:multiple sugar transport system permease protein
MSAMMLPGAVTLIPTYLAWGALDKVNTFWPLILPSFFGGGIFNIFLLRQFYNSIPMELDEAAFVDGASNLQIYMKIIIPLSRPAIVVVALFTFLGVWNDYFGPIIYLNDPKKFTLAIGLLQFRGEYQTKWNLVMAASTVVIIPCLIVFLFGQKQLIEGISLTGLKG